METIKKGSKGEDVKTLQKALNLYVDGIFGPLTEEAVKIFQKDNGLIADGIVGEKTWKKLLGKGFTLKTSKRNITKIILHCTATPEGKDYTVEQIRQWHLARGFSDIGYHYVIGRDGTIYNGRDVNISGAHTAGQNYCSIGISYIGGCAKDGKTPKDTRTEAQKKSTLDLLKALRVRYNKATIHGHYEFANKACPCFDVKEYSNI